jgi:hypothetical protein
LETVLLRRFIYANHERRLNRTYGNRLANWGRTAQGVFWRSQTSQIARFDALLSLVHQLAPQTVYHGVDINRAMIAACHQTFPVENARFTIGNTSPKLVDFCVFSGTFNLTHSDDPNLWMDYIFACLDRCMERARYGLVLNLLCAPKTNIESQIFYADRAGFIRRAEAMIGPTHARSTKYVSGDVSFVITRKT